MQWLGNNGIGYHPSRIGFVSITTCQAIVYVTDQNLFGLHNYDWGGRGVIDPSAQGGVSNKTADDWLALKAQSFAQYVQGIDITHQAHSRIIYAVINASNRYTTAKAGVGGWQSDVQVFANALNFKGKRLGIRVPPEVGNGGGVNVLFDRKNSPNHEVEIFYQKYDKSKWKNTGASRNPASGSTRGVKISSSPSGKFETTMLDDNDLIGYTMQDASRADMTIVAGHEWKKNKSLFSF
jgi:hypothetical protein